MKTKREKIREQYTSETGNHFDKDSKAGILVYSYWLEGKLEQIEPEGEVYVEIDPKKVIKIPPQMIKEGRELPEPRYGGDGLHEGPSGSPNPQQPSDSAGEEVYVKRINPKFEEWEEFESTRVFGHATFPPDMYIYEPITRPTLSEEEIEKLNPWIKGNSKYYTPWEMGFKAAIKELLNR